MKGAGDVLLEKIESRFENRDYKVNGSVNNPFESLGKQLASFKVDLKKDKQFLQQIRSFKVKGVNEASLFKFASEDKSRLGIENPELLEIVKDKVEDFIESTDHEFKEENFYKLNNELLSYPSSRSGVNEILDKSLNNDNVTETQRRVGKNIIRQVNAAVGLVEQLAVVTAIEKDVSDSQIETTDKDFLLAICALLKEDFKQQLGQGYATKTATIIVAVIVTSLFAIIGRTLICDSCTPTGGSCPPECEITGLLLGAAMGGVLALMLIPAME